MTIMIVAIMFLRSLSPRYITAARTIIDANDVKRLIQINLEDNLHKAFSKKIGKYDG